ncbi:hypothetical protein PJ311_14300 [Bacillus sp. CLL-7-23]|uniref:Uncharacterized protein n=1 Tax=Bacillus changyiensis TaxID=3004103 RepID=A0ABT4X638_9BACI|nr:hypothetical protein [Bacillus changyiensis]MDA1477306.1 hypothetical protein [Bacillus changyiensis]MDA7027750.1 hypothetical protein [Bacillus changyiensis]
MKITVTKGPCFKQAEANAYGYLLSILVQRMEEHQKKVAKEQEEANRESNPNIQK